MATLAVYPVTTSGDETTPVELWLVAGATTVMVIDIFAKNKYVSPVTTQGDDINPAELWLTPTPLRIANSNRNIRAQDSVFDPMAGYIFVLNPATVQPQVPRSTQFPYAS